MREPTVDERRQIAAVLAAPDEFLYAAIGSHFLKHGGQLGVSPGDEPSQSEKEARGRSWFQTNLDSLRKAICSNQTIRQTAMRVGQDDNQNLVLLIGDVVAQMNFNIPPFFVSALIVKIGVTNLCKDC